MAAATHNIIIEVGSTFTDSFQIQNNVTPPTNFDLTGYTGSAMVRLNPSDKNPLATFTVVITAPATLGQFTYSLAPSITAALKPGVYSWDLVITAGSVQTRLMAGTATVVATITR